MNTAPPSRAAFGFVPSAGRLLNSPYAPWFWAMVVGLCTSGCISKNTHIGDNENSEKSKAEERDSGTDGAADDDDGVGPTSPGNDEPEPSGDDELPDEVDAGEQATPKPSNSDGSGGTANTGPAGGAGGTPSNGGASGGGAAASGGVSTTGGNAGTGGDAPTVPTEPPGACDGEKDSPARDLNLEALSISDPQAMTGISVAFDGTGFIVAWVSGIDTVRFASLALDGTVNGDGPWELPRAEDASLEVTDTKVVHSGKHEDNSTLIAWNETGLPPAYGTRALYGNWVGPDGTPELNTPLALIAPVSVSTGQPRIDATWLDVDGGRYAFGSSNEVVTLSEFGDIESASEGAGNFIGLAAAGSSVLALTWDGGPTHPMSRFSLNPLSVGESVQLGTVAQGCYLYDLTQCPGRVAWSGPISNEFWTLGGADVSLQRFASQDGAKVGTAEALGASSARVMDARYDEASGNVGILFFEGGGSPTVKVALRRGESEGVSVIADAGAIGPGNEADSGQLVWADEDLYAFWLARPAQGGARKMYMTQVLCR